MRDGCTLLEACPAGGSADWPATVKTWTLLEEAYGFQTSVSLSPCRIEEYNSLGSDCSSAL
jgi:hypothetical protein